MQFFEEHVSATIGVAVQLQPKCSKNRQITHTQVASHLSKPRIGKDGWIITEI
jgi:hypothetical protein